ncbi:peptidoglycan DD-metalloendopeptidase family protein [Lentibacillus juripiscarius]|uniref:Peptidoglycan DD-metalloendopeptidase family protein n=1 Tax=Lentibacillus juripiscarius TaxID=257446 RepID=A0ABW5V373_9BACI
MRGIFKLSIGILVGLVMFFCIVLFVGVLLLGMFFGGIGFNDKNDQLTGTPSKMAEKEIPEQYIPMYKKAGERYDVPWLLLAALHRVETLFSTIEMESPVGAEGHLQFMPCSWLGWDYPFCKGLGGTEIPKDIKTDPKQIEKYGGFGVDANGNGIASPWEEKDAIFAAANHLEAYITKSSDLRKAIRAYNHADWYVDEVMHFYNLYNAGFVSKEEATVEIKGDQAWVVPHTKNLTSTYGYRVIEGERGFHAGIDIAGGQDRGKPITAFADGKVVYSAFNRGGFGNLVIMQHENGLQTYYAHMMKTGVEVGEKIKAGQIIGQMGTTGDSTGVHLHFEIHQKKGDGTFESVDPMPYINKFLANE